MQRFESTEILVRLLLLVIVWVSHVFVGIVWLENRLAFSHTAKAVAWLVFKLGWHISNLVSILSSHSLRTWLTVPALIIVSEHRVLALVNSWWPQNIWFGHFALWSVRVVSLRLSPASSILMLILHDWLLPTLLVARRGPISISELLLFLCDLILRSYLVLNFFRLGLQSRGTRSLIRNIVITAKNVQTCFSTGRSMNFDRCAIITVCSLTKNLWLVLWHLHALLLLILVLVWLWMHRGSGL
jgi:hypothetical protein